MAIKPYQADLNPTGHFDFLDSEIGELQGGELAVLDKIEPDLLDKSTPDVFLDDNGYKVALRLATGADTGPFFLVGNLVKSNNPTQEVSSLYSTSSSFAKEMDASSKVSIYSQEGFYSISSDAIDTATVNSNTEVYTRLYVGSDGKLTATPSASGATAAWFIEYRSGDKLREHRAKKFSIHGTHEHGDTVLVFKTNADGYLNLDVIAEAVGERGKLGVPTDGYFSDGYFEFDENTTVVDAIDDLNELGAALSVPAPNPLFFEAGATVDIYVGPDGDDSSTGFSEEHSLATIQEAANRIPDGFKSNVRINHLGGTIEEKSIVFNSRPGFAERNTPEVRVIGNMVRVSGPWALSGNGSAIVVDGVTKQCQRSRVIDPWGFDLVDGEHFVVSDSYRDVVAEYIDSALSAYPVVSSQSDESTGKLVLVHAAGGNRHAHFSDGTYSMYRIGDSDFSNILEIHSRSHRVKLVGFSFSGAIAFLINVAVTACNFPTQLWLFCDDTLAGGYGSFVSGCHVGQLRMIVPSTSDNYRRYSRISRSTFKSFVYLAGGFSLVSGLFSGGRIAHITDAGADYEDNLRLSVNQLQSCDFEGLNFASPYVYLRDSKINRASRLSFHSTMAHAFTLSRGSFLTGASSVSGKVAATPVIIESGSQVEGLSSWSIVNDTTPGEEIKVGSRAPQTFASLPANDFVNEDGSYNAASQGCRAS